jgi:hypothetical protein
MAAVNRPTNIKDKEADVNRKLQFYGIATGMFSTTRLTVLGLHLLTKSTQSLPKWQGSIRMSSNPLRISISDKYPQNEQIDIALNSFVNSHPIANPSKKLSVEGQALVADFRDVVKQAQKLLLTKNEGNILQDFIWQSQKIEGGNAALPGAPVDKETAKQHGNEALEGLRTLGTLIISNGQFRKLCESTPTIAKVFQILIISQ